MDWIVNNKETSGPKWHFCGSVWGGQWRLCVLGSATGTNDGIDLFSTACDGSNLGNLYLLAVFIVDEFGTAKLNGTFP